MAFPWMAKEGRYPSSSRIIDDRETVDFIRASGPKAGKIAYAQQMVTQHPNSYFQNRS